MVINSCVNWSAEKLKNFQKSFRTGNFRLKRRAVLKNGVCNTIQNIHSKGKIRLFQDFFTTLIDLQWRWTLTNFAIAFLGSWLIFGLLWWLIAFVHGDLEPEHLPGVENSTWIPCVLNIHGFPSCFLYSLETQFTTGYGGRMVTEECPEAIFMLCLQAICGMMIDCFMVGIIFAKMTRSKQRAQTILFSRNAVISLRDGTLCLMFRIGDLRKSHIIGASIKAELIKSKKTKEGEILKYYRQELSLTVDEADSNIFFIWPMVIVHKIDEDSPFYQMSAKDMLEEKFEIIVILDGTVESTSQSTQVRSSYLSNEILWGHRFLPIVDYKNEDQHYEVNYKMFNKIEPVATPLCSAKEFKELQEEEERNLENIPRIKLELPTPKRNRSIDQGNDTPQFPLNI